MNGGGEGREDGTHRRSSRVRATEPGARGKRYGAKFPSDSDLLSSETLEGEKVRGGTRLGKFLRFRVIFPGPPQTTEFGLEIPNERFRGVFPTSKHRVKVFPISGATEYTLYF
jgi:hypothetical protein